MSDDGDILERAAGGEVADVCSRAEILLVTNILKGAVRGEDGQQPCLLRRLRDRDIDCWSLACRLPLTRRRRDTHLNSEIPVRRE